MDDGPGGLHRIEPLAHPGRTNAFQAIAYAHVEDGVTPAFWGLAQQLRSFQNLDEHGRLDVLAQRLLQLQFRRRLNCGADVGDVDGGTRDGQLVENLDRLQLDDARTGQPAEGDVLR